MIYCVVPEPLADELYDRLNDYYSDDPERRGDRGPSQEGAPGPGATAGGLREVRDRRRQRVAGEFPPIAEG